MEIKSIFSLALDFMNEFDLFFGVDATAVGVEAAVVGRVCIGSIDSESKNRLLRTAALLETIGASSVSPTPATPEEEQTDFLRERCGYPSLLFSSHIPLLMD